jgi:hydroxymethylpyrimidine/phosphomethylpyrimidine kinase
MCAEHTDEEMINTRNKTALTIAGSDPSGGAGLQADLKTFQALGVYGMSVSSVLTAQNTEGVYSIHELSSDFISEQLDVLMKDIKPDAVKTGMLYTTDAVRLIANKIQYYKLQNLVIDPVTVSSTGVKLIEDEGLDSIKNELFPLATVITPNIYEAGVFINREINNTDDMKKAAVELRELGAAAVIITGGHLEDKAIDVLFDGEEFLSLENERLDGEFHGTGCVFSASVAAGLALGYDVKAAVVHAKNFTYNAMKFAFSFGEGMNILNV